MKNEKVLAYILIAIPVICFFIITISYSQNIPYNDDYQSIITFLLARKQTTGFGNTLQLYFSAYAEHRLFFVRFFSALQTFFCGGKVNFAWLPFIGNLSFLTGYIFLIRSARFSDGRKLLYLVPTAYFFFHLQAWGIHTWAMGSLSHLIIICWIILALYFLFKPSTSYGSYIAGLFFALMATYTNGNGVFVFFVAAFTFFCLKQYNKGAITLAFFLCFFIMNVLLSSDPIASNISAQKPGDALEKLLLFLGCSFFHPSYLFIAMAAGIFFVVYFAYLFFWKKYYTINPVACSLYLFIFITALAVSTQREMLDIYTIAASRFRVYGSLLIVLSYISFLEVFPRLRFKKGVLYAVLPVAIPFFAVSTYAGKSKMRDRYQLNRSYAFLWDNHVYLDNYLDSMYHLAAQNRYITPQHIVVSSLATPANTDVIVKAKDTGVAYKLDTAINKEGYILLKGWVGKTDKKNTLNRVYAVVYTHGNTKAYEANHLEVPAFMNDKEMFQYATCGFLAVIPGGEYQNADSVLIAISRDINKKEMTPVFSVKPTVNTGK